MIYSIRIRFLLAILSVIVGAEIYQGLQHDSRDFSLQQQKTTRAEKKVTPSPATVSFQPRHSELSLSMLMGQSSTQKPFSIIRIDDTQQLIPSHDNMLAGFIFVRSKNITVPILELSQPLFDLQAQCAKDLWPNNLPKDISPVVTEEIFFPRVQFHNHKRVTTALKLTQSFGVKSKDLWPSVQPKVIAPVIIEQQSLPHLQFKSVKTSVLKFVPLFLDIETQGRASLWPHAHRHYRLIRPMVIFVQASLPLVKPQQQAVLPPDFIRPFDFFSRYIHQNANALWQYRLSETRVQKIITAEKNVISPVVTAQVSVSPIQFQKEGVSALKFMPRVSNFNSKNVKGLWPHRYLNFIHREIVVVHAPSPQIQSQKLTTFFSNFIAPFDFSRWDIIQSKKTIPAEKNVISPVVTAAKVGESPIQLQKVKGVPALNFTPHVYNFNSKNVKGLWPHRYLNFIHREIVIRPASPTQVQSQKLTTFFSNFIPSFDLSRWNIVQPKKIITAEKRVISSPVVHLHSPPMHILKFKQSFSVGPKALWPNAVPKVISPVATQQVHLSHIYIHSQNEEILALKFTPLFSDSNTQGLKNLWPNHQHRYARPVFVNRIVYIQKTVSHAPSLNLISFFSKVMHPYELLTQHVVHRSLELPYSQPKRVMLSQKKIIPSAVVSLQEPLSVTPISIQSVALMGDVGHTQLVMRLSQTPFYTVSTDSSHQTITLIIDNVNPDISTIPPLDTQGTAIQNIVFNVAPGNKLLVTLSLLPQMEIQGLRFVDNNLVLDAGVQTKIPYVHSQDAASSSSDAVELMVKRPSPMTPDEAASENYDEAVDLLSQKNMEGAAGLLEMVVAEHPDYLEARILLARVRLEQNDAVQALTLLQGVVSQPNIQDNSTYYDLLAESYRQAGDLKSALKVYRQLLAIDSTNGAWWVGLGMCFEGLHQSAASLEAYQRAQLSGNLSPLLQDFVSGKLGSDK